MVKLIKTTYFKVIPYKNSIFQPPKGFIPPFFFLTNLVKITASNVVFYQINRTLLSFFFRGSGVKFDHKPSISSSNLFFWRFRRPWVIAKVIIS
jgi:hypothetical protein